MYRILFILMLAAAFLNVSGLQAQSYKYDFNEDCMQAYDRIFELRFNEAISILDKEKKEDPGNLVPTFLENYIDFLTLFISEEDALFKELESNKALRLNILKQGDKNSPFYLYTQAEVQMQWAFSRIKYNEYVKAFLEIRKAYKMLQANAEKFPDFKPNLKSLGVLHTLLGAIPDKYKTGAKILGMQGSISQGIEELSSVIADDDFVFREEALIMYAMLQLHLNKNEAKAWDVVQKEGLDPSSNPLDCFVASSIALHTGRNDEMIELLINRPTGPEYFPFPYLDFYLGLAKLNRLDDDADVYFKKYLENYKGKNYIKESYRKLSWFYFLNGKKSWYNYYNQMCVLDGDATSDEDKSAYADAKSGRKPHGKLLKARLLFDGAYYDDAFQIIEKIDPASLVNEWYRVEYHYRKGRILDKMDRIAEAKEAYLLTIKTGSNLPTFFSPNSCIKLAYIFEREGNKEQASKYYNKALDYNDHEYKNSIDAEAKAGLNRMK